MFSVVAKIEGAALNSLCHAALRASVRVQTAQEVVNRLPGKRFFQYALSREIRIIRQAVSLPKTCLKSKTQVRIL